ncbi:GSCOCG00007107001-RA-CDS [Cotesia congregata]|nr:GSCOCG00007107001-RA-CDS [Cotesia congregata]
MHTSNCIGSILSLSTPGPYSSRIIAIIRVFLPAPGGP